MYYELIGAKPEKEEVSPLGLVEFEYFFIFKSNQPLFSIYDLLTCYLQQDYRIDSAIALKLLEEEKLPIKDSLLKLTYLHSGFLNVILSKK